MSQSNLSQMSGGGYTNIQLDERDSVIKRISKLRDFDFLKLRDPDHKYYKRIFKLLKRYHEDHASTLFFSEHIMKIDTQFEKHKRILVVTPDRLFQLSKTLSVMVKVKLKEIKGLTIIKKNASLIAIHCPGSYDHLIEIVRRSEFIVFLLHSMQLKGIPAPKIKYAN